MKVKPITLVDYKFDKERLIEIANEVRKDGFAYYDDRMDKTIENVKIARVPNPKKYPEIMKIMMDFEIYGKVRFYWTDANTDIPMHTDNNGLMCSLNFLLSDELSPITIEDEEYYYEQCLLDTTSWHGVTKGPRERLLFKIAILNESYEDLQKRLKYKKEM